ncbi:MAG TPA: hypothetical protein VJ873_06945 [bacterium]|nr:hypothetical protein [bacterium]
MMKIKLWFFAVFSIGFMVGCQQLYNVPPLAPAATPLPTGTPTNTPTRTVTPVLPTWTPTATGTPATVNIYCNSDNTSGMPVTGKFGINNTQSIVPLCNGWVLYGDRVNNQIVLVNVVTGVTGNTYQLSAQPGDLAYDSVNGILYATLASATSLAKVNLNNGQVSYINGLPYSADRLCIGPNGIVFTIVGVWASQELSIVNGAAGTVISSSPAPDVSFPVYNFSTNEFFLGVQGTSPSALYRYSFNTSTYVLTQLQSRNDVGSNGEDIAISPDDAHLAFPVGSGNNGYVITDFDPSDITTTYGSWNTGPYPVSADFSPNSQQVVTTNDNDVIIYNVATHAVSKQWLGVNTGAYYQMTRARFSRGGGMVFGLDTYLYSTTQPATIFWGLYP